MGCGGSKNVNNNTVIEQKKIYFNAYKNLKNMIISFNNCTEYKFNGFIISTDSIKNYISIINKYNIFDHLDNEEKIEELEEKLKNDLINDYELENIEIIHDYSQFKDLSEKNKNEFIIVNKNFIENMSKKDVKKEEVKEVLITIDKNKNINTIEFKNSSNNQNNTIIFKEKKKGIYEFFPNHFTTIINNSNKDINNTTSILNKNENSTYVQLIKNQLIQKDNDIYQKAKENYGSNN